MAGTSASALEMLPQQKDGKDEEQGRNADWLDEPEVFSMSLLCVGVFSCALPGPVCILLFPPVQVAGHGEPH